MTKGRTAEWREGDPLPTCPNCTGGDVSASHSYGLDCEAGLRTALYYHKFDFHAFEYKVEEWNID